MLKSGSTGSGVIIDSSGLVVTNHHVAGKATRLTCRLYDGEEVGADLLGADALTDLAVLRLRREDRPKDAQSLTTAVFGDSDLVRVGDPCFAMGSRLACPSLSPGNHFEPGFISNRSASFRLDYETPENLSVGRARRDLSPETVVAHSLTGEIIGINEVAIATRGAIPRPGKHVSLELAEKGYIERSGLV